MSGSAIYIQFTITYLLSAGVFRVTWLALLLWEYVPFLDIWCSTSSSVKNIGAMSDSSSLVSVSSELWCDALASFLSSNSSSSLPASPSSSLLSTYWETDVGWRAGDADADDDVEDSKEEDVDEDDDPLLLLLDQSYENTNEWVSEWAREWLFGLSSTLVTLDRPRELYNKHGS